MLHKVDFSLLVFTSFFTFVFRRIFTLSVFHASATILSLSLFLSFFSTSFSSLLVFCITFFWLIFSLSFPLNLYLCICLALSSPYLPYKLLFKSSSMASALRLLYMKTLCNKVDKMLGRNKQIHYFCERKFHRYKLWLF